MLFLPNAELEEYEGGSVGSSYHTLFSTQQQVIKDAFLPQPLIPDSGFFPWAPLNYSQPKGAGKQYNPVLKTKYALRGNCNGILTYGHIVFAGAGDKILTA